MASKASMIVRCIGNLKTTPKSAIICPFIGISMITNFFVGDLNEFKEFFNKDYEALEKPNGKWFVVYMGYMGVATGLFFCAPLSNNFVFPIISTIAGATTGALAADYPQLRIFSNLEKRLFKQKKPFVFFIYKKTVTTFSFFYRNQTVSKNCHLNIMDLVNFPTPTSSRNEKLIIVSSKRDDFLSTHIPHQAWSLPDSVIYYISKNPSTPKCYQKIIQSCKYFFIKNPLLVISRCIEYQKNGWKILSSERIIQLENVTTKFWICDEMEIKNCEKTDINCLSSLIPKIYQSNIKRTVQNEYRHFKKNRSKFIPKKCSKILAEIIPSIFLIVSALLLIYDLQFLCDIYNKCLKKYNKFRVLTMNDHPMARFCGAILGGSLGLSAGFCVGGIRGIHAAAIGGPLGMYSGQYMANVAANILQIGENKEIVSGVIGGAIAGVSAASVAIYFAKKIDPKYL